MEMKINAREGMQDGGSFICCFLVDTWTWLSDD